MASCREPLTGLPTLRTSEDPVGWPVGIGLPAPARLVRLENGDGGELLTDDVGLDEVGRLRRTDPIQPGADADLSPDEDTESDGQRIGDDGADGPRRDVLASRWTDAVTCERRALDRGLTCVVHADDEGDGAEHGDDHHDGDLGLLVHDGSSWAVEVRFYPQMDVRGYTNATILS